MHTHDSEIIKDTNQASLIWMSITLQLTPRGYSSGIIVPFSLVKPNLCQCVFEASKYPTMKAETERKKEDTMRTCEKRERKSKEGAYAEGKA